MSHAADKRLTLCLPVGTLTPGYWNRTTVCEMNVDVDLVRMANLDLLQGMILIDADVDFP